MRSLAPTVIVFACVSLLAIQFSGLHAHANLHGGDMALHGTHIHEADPDTHDHSADVDVSLFELGIVWSKLLPFLVSSGILLVVVVWILRTSRLPISTVPLLSRRSRWRPPLRAPPHSA